MANRGYDVVVDVDAEVSYHTHNWHLLDMMFTDSLFRGI